MKEVVNKLQMLRCDIINIDHDNTINVGEKIKRQSESIIKTAKKILTISSQKRKIR